MTDTSVVPQTGREPIGRPGGDVPETPIPGSSRLNGAARWVAIVALAVWLAFSVVMLFNIGKAETEWTRMAWVFGSIQSVAFAAAGALFGTAVQQQNVDNAKQDAASAKQDADQQRDQANKGRTLAMMMQAEGSAPSAADQGGLERMGPGRAGAADTVEAVRRRHAQLSRSLFGDLIAPG